LVHRISIGKTQESTILWNGYCRAVWFIGNHQRKGKGIFPMVQLSQEKCTKETSTQLHYFHGKSVGSRQMIGSVERTRRAAERPRNGVRLFLYEIKALFGLRS
jgi:hypothetical protein